MPLIVFRIQRFQRTVLPSVILPVLRARDPYRSRGVVNRTVTDRNWSSNRNTVRNWYSLDEGCCEVPSSAAGEGYYDTLFYFHTAKYILYKLVTNTYIIIVV